MFNLKFSTLTITHEWGWNKDIFRHESSQKNLPSLHTLSGSPRGKNEWEKKKAEDPRNRLAIQECNVWKSLDDTWVAGLKNR